MMPHKRLVNAHKERHYIAVINPARAPFPNISFKSGYMVIQTYAIDSSGCGLEYGKRGINIPSLLLLTGMVIAIIGCF